MSERPGVDDQRPLTREPRLSEGAGVLEDTAEVAEVGPYGRVLSSVTLFIDGGGTLEALGSVCPITEVAEHTAEELEVSRNIRVNRPVSGLMGSQGSLQEYSRFAEHPEVVEHAAEVAEHGGGRRMAPAVAGLHFGERVLETCADAGEIVGIAQEPPAGVAGGKCGAFVAFDALSVEETCDSTVSHRSR